MRAFAQPVTYLGVTMIVSVLLITMHLFAKDRQNAIDAATRNGDNLALLLEQHLLGTIRSADQALQSLRRSYLADPAHFNLATWVESFGLIDNAMFEVAVIGTDGMTKTTSAGPVGSPVSLENREEFLVHVAAATDDLFIGIPVNTGKWSINMTRRLTAPDGTFAGVISASLDPSLLVQFYKSIDLGEFGLMSIVGVDGRVRIRRNATAGAADEASYGRLIPQRQLFAELQHSSSGHYWSFSARVDDVRRLVSYRAVQGHPLIVVVGFSEGAIFKNEWRNARIYLGTDAILFVAISVAMWVGAVRQRRLLSTQSELEQARETLDIQNRRFKTALENMPQGLAMFDADNRLVVCNTQYARMFGQMPDDLKPGTPLSEIMESRFASGIYFQASKEERLREQRRGIPPGGKTEERTLADGRIIAASLQPMADGGWVTTHTDVTETTKRERSFQLLFKSNPIPMWVYDTVSLRFLAVNEAAVAHYGYSRAQFLGMTTREIRPIEEREAFSDVVRANNGVHDGEQSLRHLTSDGGKINVATYTRELNYKGHSAVLVAAVDITDRTRAEEEVRQTKAFLDTVIESVPVPITVKEAPELRYVLANRATETLFGLTREQIIGKTVRDLFPNDMADDISARDIEVLRTGESMIVERSQFHTIGRSGRCVVSKRIPIPGADGKSRHLLGVLEDITERKNAEAQIVHMARHDALSGLANRTLFTEELEKVAARCRQRGLPFAVHIVDLDRFKEVNDSLGHPAGDALIKEAARRLRACVPETDTVARLGGDEFAILQIVENDPRGHAIVLAGQILELISAPYVLDGQKVTVGSSIGISLAPDHGDSADLLMKNADLALYRVKVEGRNGFRFFESEMEVAAKARRALEVDLRGAVSQEKFEVHYQPVVDAASRETVGMEALVRWRHRLRGLILPADFIPVAEETDLIVPLGEWVLRSACSEAACWPGDIKLAVNLSAAQFKKGNLVEVVASALVDSGLAPERLELEITESVLLRENEENLAVLHQLRALGAAIVLDDFGTGYSSLSYLRMFPFDKIKIDRSFVKEILIRADCAAIVCAVLGMAKSLDIITTAEGIETQEQLDLLQAAGCTQAQGYLFSRPVPASELMIARAGKWHKGTKVA